MSSTALAKNRKTPGVYVTEFPAFPPSIVGVATAVPIFIGYTASAADPSSGKQMYMQAVPLSSMADYLSYFGGPFDAQGAVYPGVAATAAVAATPAVAADGDKPAVPAVAAAPAKPAIYDFQALSTSSADAKTLTSVTNNYLVSTSANSSTDNGVLPLFNLYAAMELFFSNGGGNCFVISVGNYWGDPTLTANSGAPATPIKVADLIDGLDVANNTRGATMLVVPEACMLAPVPATASTSASYSDYGNVVKTMLQQAATLQDRVAIIDLPGALDPAFWSPDGMTAQANYFFAAIAPAAAYFSYGAAYGPALESSLLSVSDVDYTNLAGTTASQTLINNLLTSQALQQYPVGSDGSYAPSFVAIAARIAAAFPAAGTLTAFGAPAGVTSTVPSADKTPVNLLVSMPAAAYTLPANPDAATRQALDQYLLNATPLLGNIQQILANQLNVVPPSGVLAGVWAQNDANRGVWNAPANISLNQIVAPKVQLSDAQQGDFNVPLNGNAIDILRAVVNRGTVVWGARTLDGNSLDYRYIQVRRTLNYIEQSIKTALQQFVFAANDGGTWATVTAAISNFLTQFWQAGGLMGDKASDAFTVACGVPTTMSGLDVLNGYMIVNVTVQLIHPAEFIELTFSQTMQGA